MNILKNWWKLLAVFSTLLGVIGIILIATAPSSIKNPNHSEFIGPKAKPRPIITLWPNGHIPYVLETHLDTKSVQLIMSEMQILQNKTCIRFSDWVESDKYWFSFTQSDSELPNHDNYPIGRDISTKGAKLIAIPRNCTNGEILRAIGRAVGLDFEDTRPDRDKYIRYEPNCAQQLRNLSTIPPIGHHHSPAALDIFFDYSSIMLRESACLEPILNGEIKLGSARLPPGFSVLDVEKINAMYNCSGCKSYRFRPSNKFNYTSEDFPIIGGKEIGGYGRRRVDLYICRVYQLGTILVGKITTDPSTGQKTCWVVDRGHEHAYDTDYEILTNPGGKAKLRWELRTRAAMPVISIIGGRDPYNSPIFVGQCKIEFEGGDTTVTGSILPNIYELSVPFNHMARKCSVYNVLTCDE